MATAVVSVNERPIVVRKIKSYQVADGVLTLYSGEKLVSSFNRWDWIVLKEADADE